MIPCLSCCRPARNTGRTSGTRNRNRKRFTVLLPLLVALAALPGGCRIASRAEGNRSCGKIPLLVITDFGRDVDDAQALAFLAGEGCRSGSGQAVPEIAGIIATGDVPAVAALGTELFLNLFGISVPVAAGSGPDSAALAEYLRAHSLDGEPYEITLLRKLAAFEENEAAAAGKTHLQSLLREPERIREDRGIRPEAGIAPGRLIDSLLDRYPGRLRLLVLAKPSDLAAYLSSRPERAGDIHSVYIQGQARIREDEGRDSVWLEPDFDAYNLREDTAASRVLFTLQRQVPFRLLGKYAAYPAAFTRGETDTIALKYGPAGEYMREAALTGLRSFLQRDSALFYRIFKMDPRVPAAEALDRLGVLNNPYDLLAAMAVTRPELFDFRKAGRHALAGNAPDRPGLRDPERIKSLFLQR